MAARCRNIFISFVYRKFIDPWFKISTFCRVILKCGLDIDYTKEVGWFELLKLILDDNELKR